LKSKFGVIHPVNLYIADIYKLSDSIHSLMQSELGKSYIE